MKNPFNGFWNMLGQQPPTQPPPLPPSGIGISNIGTGNTQNQLGNIYANQYAAMQNAQYQGMKNAAMNLYTTTTFNIGGVTEDQAYAASKLLEAYMAQTPEAKVKNKVKEALDELDAYYCMPLSGGFGNSGVPDIVACVEGWFFGIECKAGKNKPTALQEKHLADITVSKGAALVIDESNVANVKHLIIAKLGELNARERK